MTLRLLFIISTLTLLASCNKEESLTCTTCTSDLTAEFEVCREPDGTAAVNGENTGTDYNVYLEALQETGASCGN